MVLWDLVEEVARFLANPTVLCSSPSSSGFHFFILNNISLIIADACYRYGDFGCIREFKGLWNIDSLMLLLFDEVLEDRFRFYKND